MIHSMILVRGARLSPAAFQRRLIDLRRIKRRERQSNQRVIRTVTCARFDLVTRLNGQHTERNINEYRDFGSPQRSLEIF